MCMLWYMIYDIRYIQRITMCPHGYHHNGFMETPALGTQEVRLHIVWIALWSHQSANCEQWAMHSANSERPTTGGSPPRSKRVLKLPGQWAKYPKDNNAALTVITIMVLWRLLHLGHRKYVYTLFGLHCEVTRVLKLRTVGNA